VQNGRLFPLIVSTKTAWLFSSVSSHGVLDKRAPSSIWHDRRKEKIIVLETLRSIFGAWLGLSQRGMCWSCTAGHLARRVHSHHQRCKLKCHILLNYIYHDRRTVHTVQKPMRSSHCQCLAGTEITWPSVTILLSKTFEYNQNNSKSCPYSLVGGCNLQCLPEAKS